MFCDKEPKIHGHYLILGNDLYQIVGERSSNIQNEPSSSKNIRQHSMGLVR